MLSRPAETPAAPDAAANPPFITAPLSVCLDFVRFGAALVVLVCHAAQAGLYKGWFPNVPLAQHYAVVVFFVLSGLVITASVERRPGSLGTYALARAARILPVSIPALAFSTLAFVVVTSLGGSPLHTDTYGDLSWRGALLPAVFMSESTFGAGPVWNPPYWSLCYEVWYYALFGAAVFLRGRTRAIVLLAGAFLAGPRILLLLPIWLVGVVLALTRWSRRMGPIAGAFLLAGGIVSAWMHTEFVLPGLHLMRSLAGPFRDQLSFSRFALSDLMLGVAVAAVIAGLRPLATRWPTPWLAMTSTARELAGFSFTLYLFHWPLLLLAQTLGWSAGHSVPGFMLGILVILGITYAISWGTERQRDRAKAILLELARLLATFKPNRSGATA